MTRPCSTPGFWFHRDNKLPGSQQRLSLQCTCWWHAAGGRLCGPAAGDADGAIRDHRVRGAGPDEVGAPAPGARHFRLVHPLLPGVRRQGVITSLKSARCATESSNFFAFPVAPAHSCFTNGCMWLFCYSPSVCARRGCIDDQRLLAACSPHKLHGCSVCTHGSVWPCCRLLFAYEVLTPAALKFFVDYADGAVESLWSIDQYFQFVLVLLMSTGLSFQVF